MSIRSRLLIPLECTSLAGCLADNTERGLAGAVIGGVSGGNPIAGAVVGGAAATFAMI